jgi:hypothetical protein
LKLSKWWLMKLKIILLNRWIIITRSRIIEVWILFSTLIIIMMMIIRTRLGEMSIGSISDHHKTFHNYLTPFTMLGIYYRITSLCNLLWIMRCEWGSSPFVFACFILTLWMWSLYLSCFEIREHTRETCIVCCCFELGFL